MRKQEPVMGHSIMIQPRVLSILPDDLGGKRVLDVGIGYGQWAFILRSWKRGNPYIVGVEPYQLFIENADRVGLYDELHNQTGQQYLKDHPDDQYDVILLCEVMEYHKTREEAFKLLDELEKRVRPGGILILSTPDEARHPPPRPDYDLNKLNDHPTGFSYRDFTRRGYQAERIRKEGLNLGHVVGPIAKTWWTLRWGCPPATHTTVAWRRYK